MSLAGRRKLLISIHPPRAGRDTELFGPCLRITFQSTLPVRGGTGPAGGSDRGRPHFNPPSPCGEGHFFNGLMSEMD